MIPEAVISMLACADRRRIQCVRWIRAEALHSRIDDTEGQVDIAANTGAERRSCSFSVVDGPSGCAVDKVLVVRRTGGGRVDGQGRLVRKIVGRQSTTHVPESFDSEHPCSSSHVGDDAGS